MNSLRSVLRVITDGPGAAAWNMAVDEALAVASGPPVPLTLRCYRWQFPTLSLGHHQSSSLVDLHALRERRAELVRRPTGGMAVYHDEELTVALVAREGPAWSRGLGDLVGLLSAGLAAGISSWGIDAVFSGAKGAPGAGPGRGNAACFCVRGRHEVWVGARKIAGLAARRWGRSLLVHGSLLLGRSHLTLADVLKGTAAERERVRAALLEGTVCLADLLGESPGFAEVVGEVVPALARLSGCHVQRGELQLEERALAWDLARGKYSLPLDPTAVPGAGRSPSGAGPAGPP